MVSDPEEENPNLPQDPPAVESTTETEEATMSSEIPDNAQTHPPVTEAAGLAPVVQQIQASTNSPSDFRTPKRRRMMSSPDKPGPANDNSGNDDEDGNVRLFLIPTYNEEKKRIKYSTGRQYWKNLCCHAIKHSFILLW